MTAVVSSMLGLPAQNLPLDPEKASRSAAAMAFGAILDGVMPAEPTHAHPPVPEAIEAELTPRARLGIWPTQPARFSPPKRGSSTTSSAPAGPDDGPSGQPLQVRNAPQLQELADTPPRILGARAGGTPQAPPPPETPGMPQMPGMPQASVLGPESGAAESGFAAMDTPLPLPPPRARYREPSPRTVDTSLDALLPDGPDAPEAPEIESTMFADPFPSEPDGAEAGEELATWEDVLLSRTEERAVRVEFDMDLAVEVKAARGEVDVHVDGTGDALDELGDLEFDLEQALADGGEHELASYRQTRRDPTARPQQGGNRAEPEGSDETARYVPGGRLFNGIA